jgi:soluble lytic murein transglycosylase-like protein
VISTLALRTLASGLVGASLVLLGGPALATDGDLPPGRRLVDHRVQPGETATGLAVRFHAWTDELVRHNHLGPSGALRVGQRLEIPVVVSALPHGGDTQHPATEPAPAQSHAGPREHRSPDRAVVRRAVARTAAREGVDPQLALAVSWQESGWQMGLRSGAGAIGAMQVLPETGEWMSLYAGHRLRLHRLADNATAGVTLLRVLQQETSTQRHAVAAYYQGLGAVRSDGLYGETRDYVANVLAIRRELEAGRPPA